MDVIQIAGIDFPRCQSVKHEGVVGIRTVRDMNVPFHKHVSITEENGVVALFPGKWGLTPFAANDGTRSDDSRFHDGSDPFPRSFSQVDQTCTLSINLVDPIQIAPATQTGPVIAVTG